MLTRRQWRPPSCVSYSEVEPPTCATAQAFRASAALTCRIAQDAVGRPRAVLFCQCAPASRVTDTVFRSTTHQTLGLATLSGKYVG